MLWKNMPWIVVGEGENDEDTTSTSDNEEVTFTPEQQAIINARIVAETKTATEQAKSALGELEALRSKANMSAKARNELDQRIETLSKQIRTKEEQALSEREKLVKSHRDEVDDLTNSRENWKQRYTTMAINNSITQACVHKDHTAFNPETVIAVLRPLTSLSEELDDGGKPTGNLVPRVEIKTVDKEGQNVTLDLSPIEAVKHLSEQESYAHLFKHSGSGGVGALGNRQTSPNELSLVDLAKDPEAWRKFKKEHPDQFRQAMDQLGHQA